MRFFKNLFLFFSAFIPLFVLMLVKLLIDIANNNLTFNTLNTISIVLHCVLIGLGVIGIFWNTKLSKTNCVEIVVENSKDITDKYFLQYFSLFVMFAVPLDIAYFNEFFIYLLILVFIGIVYINCALFYINPLLNILGFRFFETEYFDNNQNKKTIKIFCRKQPSKGEKYFVKIHNEHFSFISKKSSKDVKKII